MGMDLHYGIFRNHVDLLEPGCVALS